LENPLVHGLTIYRNPLEIEYDPLLARVHVIGKRALVARPFKAGEALIGTGVASLTKLSLTLPFIDGTLI
jgi:hypothetical protein